jgi:hypothetical protein
VRARGILRLAVDADATVDGRDPQCAGMGERINLIGNLRHELPRRREHQRGGTKIGCFDDVDQRHRERERLARPGR